MIRNFQVKYFLLALVICLAVFTGLFRVYQDRMIEKPIREQIIQSLKTDSVEVAKKDGVYTVEVKLKQAGDIKADYAVVEEAASKKIKEENYTISMVDHRTEKLQQDYDDLQLRIYEAMAKDNYLWLEEQIKSQALERKYQYKLYLDEDKLYLEIKNQDGFLYEVIDRPTVTKQLG